MERFWSWIRDGKKSDPGSGVNIPDPQHCAKLLKTWSLFCEQTGGVLSTSQLCTFDFEVSERCYYVPVGTVHTAVRFNCGSTAGHWTAVRDQPASPGVRGRGGGGRHWGQAQPLHPCQPQADIPPRWACHGAYPVVCLSELWFTIVMDVLLVP